MGNRTIDMGLGPAFWLSVTWIALLVISAVTVDLWTVQEPDKMDWNNLNANPGTISEEALMQGYQKMEKSFYIYWLGTDSMGRDILSRIIYGARISLSIGLIAPMIGLLAGGFLGCIAGFYRGLPESLIVAVMDIILAFPGLLLLLAVSFYLGSSLPNMILSLGFLSIPAFCRVARAKTLALCSLEFVQAAKLTGAGNLSILVREIIPNVLIPVTVYGLLVVAFMIMAEGSLSFLGLGVPAPTPSWGRMIAEGRDVLDESPHVSMIPAAIMFLTVISFNLIGDSLRNIFERGKTQI
ncbi:ABC transporter permease [Desulfobacterales bacterium HSG17]|nr:ABC transporter permease [Desulfobacterales bacterium HSG17]